MSDRMSSFSSSFAKHILDIWQLIIVPITCCLSIETYTQLYLYCQHCKVKILNDDLLALLAHHQSCLSLSPPSIDRNLILFN